MSILALLADLLAQARTIAAGPLGFPLGYLLGTAVVLCVDGLTSGRRRRRQAALAALLAAYEQTVSHDETILAFYASGADDAGLRARQALRGIALADKLAEASWA